MLASRLDDVIDLILFDGSTQPLDVIKWKEMYDKLEDTLDQCEDVGNTLESISIKNG
jgi:uncharacterized protein Yka (UPF0111/DUF47 family)